MTDPTGPTLTDAKGMGGIIAQDGFDYQVWDALVRLPAWLRSTAFEGLTLEGLEDLEARFFAPHAPHGHLLDRFQAKSGILTRSQLAEVFSGFVKFNEVHQGVARSHVLVTPGLPKELQWIARDPERVRRARPFYAPFTGVMEASDEKLQNDLAAEFGAELGPPVAQSFDVSLRVIPDHATAVALFTAALEEAFPGSEFSSRKATEAFRMLADHLNRERGRMVDRSTMLRLLAESLGVPLVIEGALAVHVRSDRNTACDDAVEIDASPFSGTEGPPPTSDEWQSSLLVPLDRTARWAHSTGRSRVRITGSYRISTAIALGWAFRSATGFELEIATRDGDWLTDDRPTAAESGISWQISPAEHLHQGRLVITIGVLRNPAQDVRGALGLSSEDHLLSAFLPHPIKNGREAQWAAHSIKNAVVAATASLMPEGIDLYYAGPAALAVAIGHRWNAMRRTQLHELRPGLGYVRSATIQ
jgi:hypothetical protein